MRMMMLAVPAVALLGAGLALRSAVEPAHAQTKPAATGRSVAVVDSAPQVARSYHAPTPRPVLVEPAPEVPEAAPPAIDESVGKRLVIDQRMYGDNYDGPVLIDVEQTIYEPLPENTPSFELEADHLRYEMTIDLE